jgi:hypothetical protein
VNTGFAGEKHALFQQFTEIVGSSMVLKRKHRNLFNGGKMVECKFEITNTGSSAQERRMR